MGRATEILAVYTFRVDRTNLEKLREIAALEHRALSQKLRLMIEQEIARHDDPESAT